MASRKKKFKRIDFLGAQYDDPRTSVPPKDVIRWIGWKIADREKPLEEREHVHVMARSYYRARELVRDELHSEAVEVSIEKP